MIVDQRFDDSSDQFPVGMRVLAVDDNPICLRLLDSLLRKCQYHVTTTSEAITALNLLRDNRNQFDLVISDVHMPDMDGFKLLELVGLEMDLPVIMLSANGDTKLVMKGITHGACDYLLKPVRIEELKNIWQHVIRRKKNDPKELLVNNNHDKNQLEVIDPNGFFDHNVKQSRKRKDQEGEDDDDNNQKKPRVVWTVELHRKFVSAVNHLGIDKAVPKKILDLMNVEKLTRENVASHLQKYRLYLKRISCVASHQANMVAALSGVDSGLLRMDAFGNGFQNAHFRSPAGVMLSRLNTPAALGIHGLPSGLVQFGHELNMNNPNHVQIGDLVNPSLSSSSFSEKSAPIRVSIGQPLDIHKGILGISASTTQSDFHEFSGCHENWQGQIQHCGAEPIGFDASINVNGSVMQGWDGNGVIDMSRQSNLSCSSSIDSSMIQGMAMMGPFSQRMETTTTTTNGLVTYNSNNEFSSVNPSFFNDSLSGKQRFLMDQVRKPQNGIFYANNNVGSLEDLIGPVMNQGKSF